MLDIQVKGLGVEGSFNHHWSTYSAQSHRRNGRDIRSVVEGLSHFGAFPTWSTCPCSSHGDVTGKLIDEDQTLGRESRLLLLECGPLKRIGFGGQFCLFFESDRAPANYDRWCLG